MTNADVPPLGAILFDFDGVIADSEPLHLAAFQRTLAEELGEALTPEPRVPPPTVERGAPRLGGTYTGARLSPTSRAPSTGVSGDLSFGASAAAARRGPAHERARARS